MPGRRRPVLRGAGPPLDDAAESANEEEPVDPLGRRKIEDFEKSRDILLKKLNNAAATQRRRRADLRILGTEPPARRRLLGDPAIWPDPVLYGAERYIPLHTMGFWNLMAAYLSHNAMTKVRDLGAFYHLIPENPNAGEWLAWWVRQISISGHLEGVFGGMQSVTEKLTDAMEVRPDPANEYRRINPTAVTGNSPEIDRHQANQKGQQDRRRGYPPRKKMARPPSRPPDDLDNGDLTNLRSSDFGAPHSPRGKAHPKFRPVA